MYKSLMKSKSISSHISDDGGYFDTVSWDIAIKLLITCIRIYRSHHSGQECSDLLRQLAEIRALQEGTAEAKDRERECSTRRQSYCDAWHSTNGSDDGLKSRVNEALATIEKWRARSR